MGQGEGHCPFKAHSFPQICQLPRQPQTATPTNPPTPTPRIAACLRRGRARPLIPTLPPWIPHYAPHPKTTAWSHPLPSCHVSVPSPKRPATAVLALEMSSNVSRSQGPSAGDRGVGVWGRLPPTDTWPLRVLPLSKECIGLFWLALWYPLNAVLRAATAPNWVRTYFAALND